MNSQATSLGFFVSLNSIRNVILNNIEFHSVQQLNDIEKYRSELFKHERKNREVEVIVQLKHCFRPVRQPRQYAIAQACTAAWNYPNSALTCGILEVTRHFVRPFMGLRKNENNNPLRTVNHLNHGRI